MTIRAADDVAEIRLQNGSAISVDPQGSTVMLPGGHVVIGRPHDTDAYRASAAALGYGADTLQMCREHDPLHAALCDWLGIESSYSLRLAAGQPLVATEARLAMLEEDAVMAVQKFARAVENRKILGSNGG